MLLVENLINCSERNMTTLRKSFEAWGKQQQSILISNLIQDVLKQGIKIATLLDLVADQGTPLVANPIAELSKLLNEKETERSFMIQRIHNQCVEPLAFYPTLCDRLLVLIKD